MLWWNVLRDVTALCACSQYIVSPLNSESSTINPYQGPPRHSSGQTQNLFSARLGISRDFIKLVEGELWSMLQAWVQMLPLPLGNCALHKVNLPRLSFLIRWLLPGQMKASCLAPDNIQLSTKYFVWFFLCLCLGRVNLCWSRKKSTLFSIDSPQRRLHVVPCQVSAPS